MRKRHNRRLNNKGFTLMEIMLAVSLVAIAVVAIGAIIIGTRNNTNQLLTDAQLHKQSNNIKDMISNEIVKTNAGIKYWVKQDDSASSAYTLTMKDDGDEYEKVLAFYRMDVKNLELNKTYYLYNSEDRTLKKATLIVDIPNDKTNAINVDDNIKSIIDGISSWEIVANNLTSFSVDLSNVEECALITFAIAVEQGISTYPAEAIVHVRSDLAINGQLDIDRLISWKGGPVIPPKAIGMLTYNGEYQTLIEAGYAEHGTMYYKVGEDGTWGMTLPSEKEVGTYKVYYYVYGDDYYTETNPNSYLTVTITRQPTAILYTDGTLVFQNDGVLEAGRTESDVVDIYFGWGTENYKQKESVPWHAHRAYITSVKFADRVSPSSVAYWFSDMNICTDIDLSNLDTSEVMYMQSMFDGCSAITSLDVSKFNTANVTNMAGMFRNCSSLMSIDVGGFNTSKVTDMRWMFDGMNNLRTITIGSNFSFAGNGSASCVLPTPSSANITGADGKWYDVATGTGYTPAEIATFQKAATYVAIPINTEVKWVKYSCEQTIGEFGEPYSQSGSRYGIPLGHGVYTNYSHSYSDGFTMSGHVSVTADNAESAIGLYHLMSETNDTTRVMGVIEIEEYDAETGYLYGRPFIKTSASINYSKGDVSYGEIAVESGELPENGSLVMGSATGNYCILKIGNTYYYYVKK